MQFIDLRIDIQIVCVFLPPGFRRYLFILEISGDDVGLFAVAFIGIGRGGASFSTLLGLILSSYI